MNLSERFKKFEMGNLYDEGLKFGDIKHDSLPTLREDLYAFILLDKIMPEYDDIISSAEHDQIWLKVDMDRLSKRITDDQIKELVACGVFYDDELDCLSMFK